MLKVATIYKLNYPLCVTILAMTLLVLFGLYTYFISMSVVHVVLRQEIIQSNKDLKTEIAELESRYIKAQYQVSNKIATAEQFSETNKKIFVSRTAPSLVLNDN